MWVVSYLLLVTKQKLRFIFSNLVTTVYLGIKIWQCVEKNPLTNCQVSSPKLWNVINSNEFKRSYNVEIVKQFFTLWTVSGSNRRPLHCKCSALAN